MGEPEALQWSTDACTIQRTVEAIGDRWSLIVLRELFAGIRRFDQMTVRTEIPRQVLTARLARFTELGIARRVPYQEPGQRTRSEYRLTDKGLDLYPVLLAMSAWGDRYACGVDGPPIAWVHRGCGAELTQVLECADGHRPESSREVAGRPGPGARRRTA
jgi:DNA-binding HxlR family transcriptional regulator